MAKKPTYNELRQQIKELKKEASKRDRIDKKLRESEEKYRKLVEHSLQGVLIIQNFRFVFANKAFSEISGYTNKEILSLTPKQVKTMVHPEDRPAVWKRFETRLTGKELDDLAKDLENSEEDDEVSFLP